MRRPVFITLLIIALIPASVLSQRKSVSKQFPVYDNGNKPDLVVDPQRFVSHMEVIDRLFTEGNCAAEEKAVGGAGYRRLLRFEAVVMNSGNGDLVAGDRNDPNNPYAASFEFASCSHQYETRGFSNYELLNKDRTVVIATRKQGFSLEDSVKYGGGKSNGYNSNLQGITSGWGARPLTEQWIDITGVPEGDYIVRVTINAAGTFDEGQNRYTNSVETSIHVPDPHKKVTIDNSPELIEK